MQTGEKYLNTSMMTPVTNNIDILHDEDEENKDKGQEAALSSSPIKNEMAANHNHPEEAEEPDANEPEKPSGRTSRYRFSRNQALAALAALAVVVGTATVISRAASGKTSSISSSMQQAAVVPVDVPGYTFIGPGYCRDEDDKNFPFFAYRVNISGHAVATADLCAKQCEDCVEDDVAFTFKGFYHSPIDQEGNCICLYNDDYPAGKDDIAFDKFKNTGPCKAYSIVDNDISSSTGEITSFKPAAGYGCYKVGGGNSKSKASKTPKAAKRG